MISEPQKICDWSSIRLGWKIKANTNVLQRTWLVKEEALFDYTFRVSLAFLCFGGETSDMPSYEDELWLRYHILEPPSIEYHPSSLDAEEGAPAIFECKYKGNEFPVTTVDWELNGSSLQV